MLLKDDGGHTKAEQGCHEGQLDNWTNYCLESRVAMLHFIVVKLFRPHQHKRNFSGREGWLRGAMIDGSLIGIRAVILNDIIDDDNNSDDDDDDDNDDDDDGDDDDDDDDDDDVVFMLRKQIMIIDRNLH